MKVDPKALNDYYCTLAAKLTGNTNNNRDELTSFIINYQHIMNPILWQCSYYAQRISKILQNMRSDSFTGHDSIPIKFLKFVADDISLP